MKIILIGLLVASILFTTALAQEPKNFGYKVMPEKLVENTEGILQIYTKNGNTPIPFNIKNLIVTSSDSDILQISEIKKINDFITTVKLKTLQSGSSNIAIAAPGFTSEEFNVKVYDIKQGEQKIILKTVPDKFTINGPSEGQFSVMLADVEGNPTPAKQDTFISITASNNEIVKLSTDYVTIKKGDYFTTGKFEIQNVGEVAIYANNENIGSAESDIEVLESDENDLQIELYIIPNKISNFASSKAYAIVQLQNSNGEPIKAAQDIPVTLQISHANAPANDRSPDISPTSPLVIPKGSTNGFTELSVLAGLEDIYNINISAENYLTSDSKNLETVFSGDISDLNTRIETIPISLTGSNEILGVLYPINSEGVAMVNTKTIENKIDSSNDKVISVSDIRIKTGEGPKLVYADLGYAQTNEVKLTLLGEERDTFIPNIYGPEKTELTLNVESLIPSIIPGTEFPIIMHMTNNEDAAWYFPTTSTVFMSPNDYIKTSKITATEGQSSIILPSMAIKEGKDTIEFGINDYTTNFNWDSKHTIPSTVELTYADELLAGVENVVSLQIVDDKGYPMFAGHDMEFKLSVNDEKIIVPNNVIIKSGTYNTFFNIIPQQSENSEISILASDFPLSKFLLKTSQTKPNIIISTVNSIEPKKAFDLVLDAKIGEVPLNNLDVEWSIQGANVENMITSTNEDGKIKLTLTPQDVDSITIQAKTIKYGEITTEKKVIAITSEDGSSIPNSSNNEVFGLNENYLGFILIPGLVVGSSILIKKKNLLEPISERFPIIERLLSNIDDLIERFEISDKLSEIKERIPIIKER